MRCANAEERERPQRDYSMMRSFKRRALAVWLAIAMPTWAQYPGHLETNKKAAPAVRAMAVLEWTGDTGKPNASRIIPISVFDGEQYQPGGLYLAKPEPLALRAGNGIRAAGRRHCQADFLTSTRRRMWTVIGLAMGRGSPWRPRPSGRSRSKAKTCPRWWRRCGDGQPHFKEGRQRKPG